MIPPNRHYSYLDLIKEVDERQIFLQETFVRPDKANNQKLIEAGLSPIKKPQALARILSRPECSYSLLTQLFPEHNLNIENEELRRLIEEQISYQGYLDRQKNLKRQVLKHESLLFKYPIQLDGIELDTNLKEILLKRRPYSLAQLMRWQKINSGQIFQLLKICQDNSEDKEEVLAG